MPSKYKKEYYLKNKDKMNAYARVWNKKNSDKIRGYQCMALARRIDKTIPKDIACAFMTGKTSEERGNEDC
jgi:hypothetical protein